LNGKKLFLTAPINLLCSHCPFYSKLKSSPYIRTYSHCQFNYFLALCIELHKMNFCNEHFRCTYVGIENDFLM
jgi:hypothetical protein